MPLRLGKDLCINAFASPGTSGRSTSTGPPSAPVTSAVTLSPKSRGIIFETIQRAASNRSRATCAFSAVARSKSSGPPQP